MRAVLERVAGEARHARVCLSAAPVLQRPAALQPVGPSKARSENPPADAGTESETMTTTADPITLHDSVGRWPFPLVTELRHRGERAWVEISDEHADHFLEVLPPLYRPGCFMVGEPAAHADDGTPIHAAVVRIRTRYFMREIRTTREVVAEEVAALRAHVAQAGGAR